MKVNSQLNVLLYTRTTGYYHESTPEAVKALKGIGIENDWNISTAEDSTYFTSQNLKQFDVIVFLLTLGNILDENGKTALKEYVESGKGLVTIHTGTITMQDWPWFSNLIGAGFIGHPPTQTGKLIIEDKNHPSTNFIAEDSLSVTEEWYSFDRNPRSFGHVLMSVDESSYEVDDNRWFEGVQQRMGDHPIAWYNIKDGVRVFQTALGHTSEAYQTDLLRKHIAGAIRWAGKISD